MKFSAIDLQCLDIRWFGVDEKGNILSFTTGGRGNVPEYVCRSKEETELLEEFFLEKLKPSTLAVLEIPDGNNTLVEEAKALAGKGVFVYDVCFGGEHVENYERIAHPKVPIRIDCLPEEIAAIMKDHTVLSTASSKYIDVDHALAVNRRLHQVIRTP